ncbi:hypothetical protein FN846DRAFT_963467 [Sphaerosporella brunnea]|uniref:Uncharacterized protein n=1 Tax=Sphaerosporella brunnea TaxID=1250544 RepID=A0A5J5ENI7_9PEZI|nr:hypothetical protein FN846DRAFT_963467 [Sphaerosporella brunnea]
MKPIPSGGLDNLPSHRQRLHQYNVYSSESPACPSTYSNRPLSRRSFLFRINIPLLLLPLPAASPFFAYLLNLNRQPSCFFFFAALSDPLSCNSTQPTNRLPFFPRSSTTVNMPGVPPNALNLLKRLGRSILGKKKNKKSGKTKDEGAKDNDNVPPKPIEGEGASSTQLPPTEGPPKIEDTPAPESAADAGPVKDTAVTGEEPKKAEEEEKAEEAAAAKETKKEDAAPAAPAATAAPAAAAAATTTA